MGNIKDKTMGVLKHWWVDLFYLSYVLWSIFGSIIYATVNYAPAPKFNHQPRLCNSPQTASNLINTGTSAQLHSGQDRINIIYSQSWCKNDRCDPTSSGGRGEAISTLLKPLLECPPIYPYSRIYIRRLSLLALPVWVGSWAGFCV